MPRNFNEFLLSVPAAAAAVFGHGATVRPVRSHRPGMARMYVLITAPQPYSAQAWEEWITAWNALPQPLHDEIYFDVAFAPVESEG